jgi:hypothetical protein
VLTAVMSIVVVVAVVAVALGTGAAVRSRAPGPRAAGSHPGPGDPIRAQGPPQATPTTAGGASYCVNSVTHAKTACSPRTAPFPNGGAFPAIKPQPGSPVRLVAQLYLHAPSGARRPAAVGHVVQQARAFGITIVGAGLSANTKRDAYAVWLTNGRRKSKLLGFVNPAVKVNGRLDTAGVLPKDAFRYDELLITRETQTKPTAPGVIALLGSFHK